MPRESKSNKLTGKPLATIGKTTGCFTAILSIGIGLFLFVIGAMLFIVALMAPQKAEGIGLFYLIGGIFCLVGIVVMFLRGGRRIQVYAEGLVIEDGKRTQIRWEDIRSIQPQITHIYEANLFFGTKRSSGTATQCLIKLKNGKNLNLSGFRGLWATNDIERIIQILTQNLARFPSVTIYPTQNVEVSRVRLWIPRL